MRKHSSKMSLPGFVTCPECGYLVMSDKRCLSIIDNKICGTSKQVDSKENSIITYVNLNKKDILDRRDWL